MGVNTRANPQGPRFLTQRNLEKQIEAGQDVPDPFRPPIAPGFMQLFSYYKPSLTAGNYAITAEQFISSKKGSDVQNLRICNWKDTPTLPVDKPSEPQKFEVMAPQFSLDPKLVNSFYPPEGHQDEGRILPHIVIEDPHFPWERDADHAFSGGFDDDEATSRLRDPDVNASGQKVDKDGNVTTNRKVMVYRSMVPWIRLLVFDVDELKLGTAQQAHDLGVPDFIDLTNPKADIKRQPANGAFSMTAKDYFNINPANRIDFESAYKDPIPNGFTEISTGRRSKESTQVIFPTKDIFYNLFQDTESNKYLAHVRNINTTGFPNAGVEEDGLYSTVISARMGSFDITKPTTQIVHLVSIENVYSTINSKFKGWETRSQEEKSERIGLISLFSWTYTSLPPDPVNFIDSMMAIVGNIPHTKEQDPDVKLTKKLGNMQMLRPLDSLTSSLAQSKDPSSQLLASRFKNGYSIARWRCETGEVTAAFSRGPLVPIQVPVVPTADWPTGSSTSKNYQILDKTTGVVDLSYSSAWQHGKILAISDTAFSAALMRFRSDIHRAAESIARAQVNGLVSKANTLKFLVQGITEMQSLLDDNIHAPRRVGARPPSGKIATDLSDPAVAAALATAIQAEVTAASQAGSEVYNEFNSIGENNTDWSAILKWITDKLYLGDIPAHILFPDPSFIPEESIRFFYIDDAWMDCLIDGALSAGNHLENDDDLIKTAIKELYNLYLRTTVPNTNIRPQIPCYGFVLRSQIVKVMPDLKITVSYFILRRISNLWVFQVNWNNAGANPPDQRAPVCQWLRPDDHTLICLLDRPPEELTKYDEDHPDRSGIVLSQPPHQQRFSFGHAYDPTSKQFEFKLRHLYTQNAPDAEWPLWDHSNLSPNNQPEMIAATKFDFTTRVLKTTELATAINNGIQQKLKGDPNHPESAYVDYVPNSAELGLELNDPAYYFAIYPETQLTSNNTGQILRQLWTPQVKFGDEPQTPTSPPPKLSDPIGTEIPIQPPGADTKVPIIPVPRDIPGQGTRIIFQDHPVSPPSRDKGNVPPSLMPMKCFTMDVFADYKGLIQRVGGVYDPEDYVPTQSKYLLGL
jgi:hypothetical protein